MINDYEKRIELACKISDKTVKIDIITHEIVNNKFIYKIKFCNKIEKMEEHDLIVNGRIDDIIDYYTNMLKIKDQQKIPCLFAKENK